MVKKPRISVIIPVYNVENRLECCLDSVLGQNYSNMEILCVDDCSTDRSREILEDYQSKYSNIKILSYEQNRRPGGARDYAIERATGDYIQFVDSDDYIEKDFLDNYLSALDDSTDIVMGGYYRDSSERSVKCQIGSKDKMQWVYPAAWNKLFRRESLMDNKIDFRGLKHYEDGPFNIRCMMHEPKINFIEYCGYHYICNSQSVTHSGDPIEKYNEYVNNYLGLKDEIANLNKGSETYQMVEYEFVQGLTVCMLSMARHVKWENATHMMEMRMNAIRSVFPSYRNNPFLKKNGLHGELPEVKIALFVFLMLERLGLDRLFVRIISR